MGSTRLPGKVLLPILGTPMLGWQLDRLARCRQLDALIVATSDAASDDPLEAWCRAQGHACHRGPVDDVLARFVSAAEPYEATWIVRLTGDCPLLDPALVDETIAAAIGADCDYFSNIEPPTFPDGMDVEVIRPAALRTAYAEATRPSDREHVTTFIRQRPERFSHGVLTAPVDLSGLRLTVDDPADFTLVTRILEALHATSPEFGLKDILDLLAHQPDWLQLNAGSVRNAGYARSVAEERPSS